MLRLWLKFARVVVASGVGIGFYPKILQFSYVHCPWSALWSLFHSTCHGLVSKLCSDKYIF